MLGFGILHVGVKKYGIVDTGYMWYIIRYYIFTHTKAKLEVGNGISANFFVTEAGNALAALGNIHEGDSHILK